MISAFSTFFLTFIELLSWVSLHYSNKTGMGVSWDIEWAVSSSSMFKSFFSTIIGNSLYMSTLFNTLISKLS